MTIICYGDCSPGCTAMNENGECTLDCVKANEPTSFKTAKWVYRLESTTPDNGLWYDANNSFVWGIGKLPDCKTKYLAMDWDERYHKDGKNWFSSCSNKEDLMHWYSLQDALNLIENGFVFTRYLATEYVEYNLETTFIKETSLAREVIDINDLFEDK